MMMIEYHDPIMPISFDRFETLTSLDSSTQIVWAISRVEDFDLNDDRSNNLVYHPLIGVDQDIENNQTIVFLLDWERRYK